MTMTEKIVTTEEETPGRKRRERPPATWCVIIEAGELYVLGGYRPLAVELLKSVAPGGARKFYRSVSAEFFNQFPLNPTQVGWLTEAGYFNGVWQVLHEYKRHLLNALAVEYPEIWLVENGKAVPRRLPSGQVRSDAEKYKFGPHIVMPLTWAKSYALYCHRHKAWESQPCKEAGVIVEKPVVETPPSDKPSKKKPGKKKWPDLELHAPQNTLVRARRKQTSYYLAAPDEPVRLGRDAEGELASRGVIDAQHLAILLRVARAMTAGGAPVPFA